MPPVGRAFAAGGDWALTLLEIKKLKAKEATAPELLEAALVLVLPLPVVLAFSGTACQHWRVTDHRVRKMQFMRY